MQVGGMWTYRLYATQDQAGLGAISCGVVVAVAVAVDSSALASRAGHWRNLKACRPRCFMRRSACVVTRAKYANATWHMARRPTVVALAVAVLPAAPHVDAEVGHVVHHAQPLEELGRVLVLGGLQGPEESAKWGRGSRARARFRWHSQPLPARGSASRVTHTPEVKHAWAHAWLVNI